MSPSVVVLIPALNEGDSIRRPIEAVTAAGVQQIVVADGGSADQTTAVARNTSAHIVLSPPGRGSQLNAAARACDGDILLCLHADSTLPDDFVAQVRQAIETGYVAGCFRQRIEADGLRYRLIEWGNAFRAKHFGWIYGDQAMFVRRDVFDRMGGFREIPLMEDLEFSKRLKREGKTTVLDGPVSISARRWQKQGVLFSTLRNWAFVVLFHLGVDPERLAKWYRNVR